LILLMCVFVVVYVVLCAFISSGVDLFRRDIGLSVLLLKNPFIVTIYNIA